MTMNTHEDCIEIVIPVYNEEEQLEASIATLRTYLLAQGPCRIQITIADNASPDRTPALAQQAAATAEARGVVLSPLTLTKVTDLDFGTVAASNTAGNLNTGKRRISSAAASTSCSRR